MSKVQAYLQQRDTESYGPSFLVETVVSEYQDTTRLQCPFTIKHHIPRMNDNSNGLVVKPYTVAGALQTGISKSIQALLSRLIHRLDLVDVLNNVVCVTK